MIHGTGGWLGGLSALARSDENFSVALESDGKAHSTHCARRRVYRAMDGLREKRGSGQEKRVAGRERNADFCVLHCTF